MSDIMNIPYHNNFMECVRQLAVKNINKLISEFVEDLDELVGWSKYLPADSEISIRLGRKVEKWEEKLK